MLFRSSKSGPRPLLDSLIRLDDGCYEPCFIYIDIQFGQIPVTAVAVQQYRPAMDSCMDGIRLYRICALTAPDSSDPGEYGWLAHRIF